MQVFDASYNGFSTDELFFVRDLAVLWSCCLRCSRVVSVRARAHHVSSTTNGAVGHGSPELQRSSASTCATLVCVACELIRPRRYSPANTVSKWSTPQLIVHGSKDFRLPETEGISAFHALQQCVVLSSLSLMLMWR